LDLLWDPYGCKLLNACLTQLLFSSEESCESISATELFIFKSEIYMFVF